MIYLDYNATTPVDPRVFEAMRPYFCEVFGNAASRHHLHGRDAARAVTHAREQVAAALGAEPREIVFTSGATESDNLALLGLLRNPANRFRGNHVVTAVTEHKAVLDPCAQLEREGYRVTYLPVDAGGRIDLAELEAAITDRTLLVSLMHANNETGVLHPLAEIGARCRARGVLFHTDASQSCGKESIDVSALGVDLLSLSGHKVYGPKGVGALFVRRKQPTVRLQAEQHGGGHERAMRSGTLNVPGIVGLGAAVELALAERELEQGKLGTLRDALAATLGERLFGVTLHGDREHRLAGTLSLSIAGTRAESVMRRMPSIAVSTASACTSAQLQPSYVLGAMGVPDELLDASLRISLGRFTTEEEVHAAAEAIVRATEAERADPGGAAPSC